MDTKEITSLVKALNKACALGEPVTTIIDILEKLKTNVVATEELLRSTKVGVAVNRQKGHKNKDIARLSAEMISKWKEDIKKSGLSKGRHDSPRKSADGDTASSPKKRSSPKKSKTPEKKFSTPLDQRTWKTDEVDPKRTGVELRDNCIGLMYNALAFCSSESPTHVLKRALDVERAGFDTYGPETQNAYKVKMRSLFQIVKQTSNALLRADILSGEMPAERLVKLSSDELKSPERRAEEAQYRKENMAKAMVAQVEKSISTAFTCGKCGQKKVSYSQAQTRSADEPMTTFCECQICGNRWKFS